MTCDDLYMLIIDTNSYAGNFERALCAYITGQKADITSSEAEEMAAIALQEIPEIVAKFDELMLEVQDEPEDYPRCVSIWPTPGYGNDGRGKEVKLTEENKEDYPYPAYLSVAIFFSERPPNRLVTIMKERALQLAAEGIPWYGGTRLRQFTIENFRLVHRHVEYIELDQTD